MREHQLSRYGAIAKSLPMVTGKTFFLVSPSEEALPSLNEQFPADADGIPRVYTTWASVISAIELTTAADCIIVSPLFTTAPTSAQIDSLNAAKVTVIQAGRNLPDGSYLATRATATLPQATTGNLFQVNGRALILDICGEVTTQNIGSTGTEVKFIAVPDQGSNEDLNLGGQASNLANLAIGGQFFIHSTGERVGKMATSQGARFAAFTPIVVKKGYIALNTSAANTGQARYTVRYIPIDPGSFIHPV